MSISKIVSFVLLFLFTLTVGAETEIETPNESSTPSSVMKVAAPPKWKASFDSYYYDFEGERPHENGFYEFGDTTLKMQMMSLSYQLNNSWTLMMLAQYYESFVVTKIGGASYEDSSRGVADTVFSAINTSIISPQFLVLTDVGVSLPTGSIDEKNPADPSGKTRYPYNMQLGSGTIDSVLGVTPLWIQPAYQVGGRLSAFVRTSGYNKNGYRLGNQYKADAWIDVPVGASGFTPRIVGYYKHRDGIRGQEKSLSSAVNRPFLEYYYHDQINWDISAALQYKKTLTPTVSFKAEVGVPMAQECINYDDVAIYTQYYGQLGMSGSF